MDTYRNPQPSGLILSYIATGQTYPQENIFSLQGTHKVGDTELREMQRGAIAQGVENDGDNLIGVLRFMPKVKAYRIRPFVVAVSDPSGTSLELGLAMYPKFFGDKLQGNSQGIVPAAVTDTARTGGMQGSIALSSAAAPIDVYTENPFTGNDWTADFVDLGADDDSVSAGEPLAIYPVTSASLDSGAFGRTLSLEGFDTANPDSGYLLIDPAFNEYLIVRMLDVSDDTSVRGVLFVIESET